MELYIDKSKLLKLLESFYTISGLKAVIFGPTFDPILSYPEKHSKICQRIRSTKIGDQKCRECDIQAQKFAKNNIFENYIYECHAGLTEAISPIVENNEPISFIIVGQCISDKKSIEESWKNTLEKCSSYVKLDDLKDEYFALPYLSFEKIEACALITSACTGYISLKHFLKIKREELLDAIFNYIDNNISNRLTTEDIIHRFFIPRNRLFKLVKSATGMSLGDFIILKRLELAKTLLETTDKSVTEIAFQCGFSDSNYFTRMFKRKYNLTPRQHRKTVL